MILQFQHIAKAMILFVCLFSCITAVGQQPFFKGGVRVGYGVQNLDWSIAGNTMGTDPNIYSELIWKQVSGINYGLDAAFKIAPKFDVLLEGNFMDTKSGRVRDTDYSGDNRTNSFYDERFSSDDGYFYNFRTSLRYALPQLGIISPKILLGYEQIGNELFLLPLPDASQNLDLRTTYQTDWYGGQAALELGFRYVNFYGSATYGFGLYDYKAKANWNLIEDFQQPVSFRHSALGMKHNGILCLGYDITPTIAIELVGTYADAFTKTGLDQLYTRSRGELTTQFNGANMTHASGSLGVSFQF